MAQSSRLVVAGEPGEPLVQAVPGGGTTRLHIPVAVADPGQAKLLLDLVRLHGCGGQRSGQECGEAKKTMASIN